MFWLTLFFFLVEIVVGYVTNSMALVADSFHMLSDVAALVVAFLSVKVSKTRIYMEISNIVNSLSMSLFFATLSIVCYGQTLYM
jgi:Co/Zn/Cd efflux system component